MGKLNKVKNFISKVGESLEDKSKQFGGTLTGVTLPFLSNTEFLKWSESITEGTANLYDKALDMEYLKTHIGGGNHRMFDGGHDLISAWDRVKDASTEDTNTEEIIGYVSAIWKDLTTTKGLPLFTWEKNNYDQYAEWFSDHLPMISKDYFYDLLSYDVFEIIGASIGIGALLFGLNNDDQKKVAEVIGSMGVTSIASANPIMGSALVLITSYVVFIKKNEIDKESLAKGAIISTISVTVFSVLGIPFLIELGIAILVTQLVKKHVFGNDEVMEIIKLRLIDIQATSKLGLVTINNSLNMSLKKIHKNNYNNQIKQLKKLTNQII